MPTLRELSSNELDSAIELRAAMVRETDGGIDPDVDYPGWRERFVKFFANKLAAKDAALYLAEADGKAVGVAAIYRFANHRTEIFGRSIAYITNVYVVPQQRRNGLGTRLTQACIDWARARDFDTIRLRTTSMGRPVYAKLGFSQSSEMELRIADRPRRD